MDLFPPVCVLCHIRSDRLKNKNTRTTLKTFADFGFWAAKHLILFGCKSIDLSWATRKAQFLQPQLVSVWNSIRVDFSLLRYFLEAKTLIELGGFLYISIFRKWNCIKFHVKLLLSPRLQKPENVLKRYHKANITRNRSIGGENWQLRERTKTKAGKQFDESVPGNSCWIKRGSWKSGEGK